jgi:hypothetical protein
MPINTVNQLGKPESLVRPGQNETKLEVPQAFKDFVAARSFGRAAVPESLATEFQHLDGSHLNAYVEVKDQQDTLDSYTDTLRKRAHHKPGLLLRTGHGIKEAAQDGVIKDINELALANIHDDSKSAIHDADKNAFNTTEDVIKGFEAVSEGAAIVSDVLKVYHGQQQIRAGQAKIKDYKNTVNEFRQKSQALIDDVNNYNKNMEIVKEYLPNAGQGGASPEQAINRRLTELQDVRELHDAVVKTESNITRYRLSNDPRIASERYRLTNLKKQLDQQQSELTELQALRSAKQQLELLSARLSNPRTIKDIATLADQAKRLHASKLVGELKGGTGQIMNTSAAAVDGIAHGVKFTDLAWPAFHALGQALAAKIAGIVLFPIKAKGAVVDAYTAHQHRTFAASADTLIRQYERTFPPDPELSAIARQVKTKQTWKGKATSATQNTLLTTCRWATACWSIPATEPARCAGSPSGRCAPRPWASSAGITWRWRLAIKLPSSTLRSTTCPNSPATTGASKP